MESFDKSKRTIRSYVHVVVSRPKPSKMHGSCSLKVNIFRSGSRREFPQFVVCPENWKEIQKTKREWTYSLYSQIGRVSVSQLLSIVDFFTSASVNTSIGIGLAINSLWV